MPPSPLEIIGLGRKCGGAANGWLFGRLWEKLDGAVDCTSAEPDSEDSLSFSASLVAAASRLRPLELDVPGRAIEGLSAPAKFTSLS